MDEHRDDPVLVAWCVYCGRWVAGGEHIAEEGSNAGEPHGERGYTHLVDDPGSRGFQTHAVFEYAGPMPLPAQPAHEYLVITEHTIGYLGHPAGRLSDANPHDALVRHQLDNALAVVARDAADQPEAPFSIIEAPTKYVEAESALDFYVALAGGAARYADGDLEVDFESPAGLLVEVADKLQHAIICLEERLWPICPTHGLGLHAELDDARPVWRCNAGHIQSSIGHLRTELA